MFIVDADSWCRVSYGNDWRLRVWVVQELCNWAMSRRSGKPVILNVYDLHPANEWLYGVGGGFYHSGLQLGNTEYSFGSGAGIFEGEPRNAPGATFRESIVLGETTLSQNEIDRRLSKLRDEFRGDRYDIVRMNCNSFTDRFAHSLLGYGIPGWVNRLSNIGAFPQTTKCGRVGACLLEYCESLPPPNELVLQGAGLAV